MLDTEKFQRAKKRILENKSLLHDLSFLEDYIDDLELVCTNERSLELASVLNSIVVNIEDIENEDLGFKVLILCFQQIYYYEQNLDAVKKILKNLEHIAERTQNVEHLAYVSLSKSLVKRLVGLVENSNSLINDAMSIIEIEKKQYLDTYYRILYTFSVFSWMDNKNHLEVIANVEKCVKYWYSNQNTLPMITGIFRLLRYYSSLGKKEKFNQLISWVFEEERMQDNILDSHFTLLCSFAGRVFAIRSRIDEAIQFLSDAYSRVKKSNSQKTMMYEYIEILKLLCRCYAFQGEFQLSYDTLMEFLNFIESEFVKQNYQGVKIKRLYFGAYYTLLFIFAQLDINIKNITDEKLRKIHNYTKTLLEHSNLSEELLLDNTLDEQHLNKIAIDKRTNFNEFNLLIHQQLLSLKTHTATDKTIDNIKLIRDYVYNPLYADIVLGKIHVSIGNFEEFAEVVVKISEQEDQADTPVLKLWIKLFKLLKRYLENPANKDILEEFSDLVTFCKSNNFINMAEEVNLFLKLITSTKAIDSLTDKFQQTAFTDIYNKQSKQMVVEFLDSK